MLTNQLFYADKYSDSVNQYIHFLVDKTRKITIMYLNNKYIIKRVAKYGDHYQQQCEQADL